MMLQCGVGIFVINADFASVSPAYLNIAGNIVVVASNAANVHLGI